MRRMLPVICTAAAMLAGDDRSPVSKSVEQRTGHGLNPATRAESLRTPGVPPGLRFTGELTEDDAVAIALWNNSALNAALGSLGLARADLVEAGLLRNPSLQMLLPVGLKPFEMVIQTPIEALWQRPRRRAVARLNLSAVSEALVEHGLDTARNARLAHTALDLAERKVRIAGAALELRRQIAELTGKRLAAGDISEFDAHTARMEVRSFEDTFEQFRGDLNAAGERLRMILGLRGSGDALRVTGEETVITWLPALEPLLETALGSRPDLRAAELGIELAVLRARWERSRILNLIAPLLSVKGVGTPSALRGGPGFFADLPVFHRNQGQIARADVEVERAALLYLSARDRVELEVREAYARLRPAAESLDRIRGQVLPAVRRYIALAERAYERGDASYLTVLEANHRLYDIQLREAEAVAGVRRARAELDRGIGRKS